MFGIGMPEMILILALALIVVGPDKLPEMARSIAKGVLELKKTVSTLKEDFVNENPLDSIKPELEDVTSSLKDQLANPSTDGWEDMLDSTEVATQGADEEPSLPSDADQVEGQIIEIESADDIDTATESAVADGRQEKTAPDIDAVSGEWKREDPTQDDRPGKQGS